MAVIYDNQWYPGQITFLNQGKETGTVKCMEYVDIFSSRKFILQHRLTKRIHIKFLSMRMVTLLVIVSTNNSSFVYIVWLLQSISKVPKVGEKREECFRG